MNKLLSLITIFCLLFSTNISGQNKTNQQISNLETFAKLYGYVKYFHPSDEASDINWDQFAIYGAQQVEKARNKEELKKILSNLFTPIAPTLKLFDDNLKLRIDPTVIEPENKKDFKLIAWQHLGVQFSPRSIYKSARLNRLGAVSNQGFGNIMSYIDASKYYNKEIKLSASVKMISSSAGSGHLWLRVDGGTQEPLFFDNMQDRPITNTEWQEYEIIGKVEDKATGIAFGTLLLGDGKLLVDNFQMQVKEGEQWVAIELADNSFENTAVDEKPGGIWTGRGDGYNFKITNESASEGTKSAVIETKAGDFKKLYDEYPQAGEFIQKKIGSGLQVLLPLALYGTEEYTYPQSKTASILKATVEENTKDLTSGENLYVRLGNTINVWNVFQHFYPYFEEMNIKWMPALTEALETCYTDKTERDFLLNLRKFTAKLKDGHVRVRLSRNMEEESHLPPFEWDWIEDKLVITAIIGDPISLDKGDIVTQIDGQDAASYFKNASQYISAATDGWLQSRLRTSTMFGAEGSLLKVKITKPDGTTKDLEIKRNLSGREYYELGGFEQIATHKAITPDIYYLNIGKIPMEEINQLMPTLQKSKAIICDLRGYPKGNHDLISHLLTQADTSKAWMKVAKTIYPDQEKIPGYKEYGWEMPVKSPSLDANIFFLTGGGAISYAESYMGLIDHYNLATIVGQPTAGTNGNVNPFMLIGGYSISWTGMKVVRHDGTQHHGVGIKPDVYVERTIEGVRANKDEFLEKAIELAKK